MKITTSLNSRTLTFPPNESLTTSDFVWILKRAGYTEFEAHNITDDFFDCLADVLKMQGGKVAA